MKTTTIQQRAATHSYSVHPECVTGRRKCFQMRNIVNNNIIVANFRLRAAMTRREHKS